MQGEEDGCLVVLRRLARRVAPMQPANPGQGDHGGGSTGARLDAPADGRVLLEREVGAATDVFTVEVLTLAGLVRHFVLFVIDIKTRRVQIWHRMPALWHLEGGQT